MSNPRKKQSGKKAASRKTSGSSVARTTKVPRPFQNQLARLFGANAPAARREYRSPAEWREILRQLLAELDRYQRANVQTDQLHSIILASALAASDEALKDADFWPGYVEGLLRYALTLMGNYPDHRARKGGRHRANHYDLSLERSLVFVQRADQQFRTLFAASQLKFPKIPHPFWEVLEQFYEAHGYSRGKKTFMKWFKRAYPEAYASLF